jgi:hypothetical protein
VTTIKPTQRDRDAAAAFFRDERTALSVKFSLGHDPDPLLETLARHAATERAIERAAIVEWLRGVSDTGATFQDTRLAYQIAAGQFANTIEAGEHNAETIARGE